MFETALGAFHMREDVGQVSESLGFDFNAGRNRSIRVGALNEQDTHATLPAASVEALGLCDGAHHVLPNGNSPSRDNPIEDEDLIIKS
jgi:hypothetical protein